MTQDLYRLFSQYYLKVMKFGNLSSFVCDFIEAETGLLYLLQVKSFECEGLLYDWQAVWNPHKTVVSLRSPLMEATDEQYPHEKECKAYILC